ncbi:MAG: hypothetical protein M3M96_08520, partial [Candidatus Eremiobacteraeota bacterium]|nr:hypothetical protein [Candidatus Eremiobacteraeota bacterium]
MTVMEHFGFDMLSAPVNAADRRALSEAWYSALYAARKAPQAPLPRPGAKPSSHPAAQTVAGSPGMTRPRQLLSLVRRQAQGTLRLGNANEQHPMRQSIARSIERALVRSVPVPRRASFTLGGEDGRVHIVVQSTGSAVRLIAFCSPKARERVAAALAQIRWDLSARGLQVHATLRG